MYRLVWPLVWCALVPDALAKPRPRVDRQAMTEAMATDEGDFSSSASYAHFLLARLAHHQGQHQKALDELRLALATDPDHPLLLTTLAEEHARLGDLRRAERELRKVTEKHPNYAPGQLLMGRVLFESQRAARAKIHLRRAIQLRPQDPEAYLVLAQLSLELDAPDDAVATVESMAKTIPGDALGFKKLGVAFIERGDYTRAQKLLRRALELAPGDADLWVAMAQIHDGEQRYAEAEDAFVKALEREPDNRNVLLGAGRVALRRQAPERARAYFDRLLSISDDAELVVKIAFSYLASHYLDHAAAVLHDARESAQREPRIFFYAGLVSEKLRRYGAAAEAFGSVPRDSDLFHEARLHQATCLSMQDRHPDAIALFKKAVEERPGYVLVYPAYARALERSGNPRGAEELLRKTLQNKPEPEIFEALSALYQRQGNFAQAVELLTQAIQKRPRDEALLYILGAAYERQGDLDKSLAQMRRVLELNPENAAALNFVGYTLAEKGQDLDEAERLVTRALELRPDTGAFLDSLGWVYFRRGDFGRAVETLERANALSPGEPVIIDHLGDAYERTARRDRALDAYRRALEAVQSATDPKEHQVLRKALERKLKLLSSESAGR